MSRTVIDLDDDLLADVARALGTRTKRETVNTALREVLENRRRVLRLGPGRRGGPDRGVPGHRAGVLLQRAFTS
jgi:Arc/MetJ family transcription regulator